MRPSPKEIQTKLMKGFLDFVILQFLKGQPMHGYQIIRTFRRNFGVYFGPSTIYPLLSFLEEKGYIKSQWNLEKGRPRKVYSLTPQGAGTLNSTQVSLGQLYKKLMNVDKLPLNTARRHVHCVFDVE